MAKLLNYMVILCLMVEDNFQVDVYYLKDDLGIQTKEYIPHLSPGPPGPHPLTTILSSLLSAFSNVGCKRKDISAIAAEAYGISKAEMKLHKVAFLTAKPEFPRAPVRRGGEKRK